MDAFPTLMPFSRGYYLVEDVCVWPSPELDVPIIHEYFYGELQTMYGNESSPIVFRHPGDESYFGPLPDDNVPLDVLGLPMGLAHEFGVDDHAEAEGGYLEDFLVAKPEHASRLAELTGIGAPVGE